jgi:putative addiction module component (TIGR02574 family)
MARSARELFEEAMTLEPRERVALTSLLIESLDPGADEGADSAWVAEIERRMNESDSGAAQPVPWEEVRNRLYSNLRGGGRR